MYKQILAPYQLLDSLNAVIGFYISVLTAMFRLQVHFILKPSQQNTYIKNR
jgi:hypothetical protein